MTIRDGAETIVNQCLNVQPDEHVVVLNDANDEELLGALLNAVQDATDHVEYMTYPEPENHGEEPPERVAEAMRESDVSIAPTKKSISHTQARVKACDAGARCATLPGITKEIWTTSLLADYGEVKELSEQVYELLSDTETVHISTPSGTDLRFDVDIDYFHTDTGIIHEPGQFGNLPAGEADGGVVNAEGTLVIDHFPFAPEGTVVEIEDDRAVAVKHPGNTESELAEAFETIEGARNVAEFGFGTNPEATLIGNVLQDEKVLGTVHVAFGDNGSYVPDSDPRQVRSDIHWDTVCEAPTVLFDDTKVLDNGTPVFR